MLVEKNNKNLEIEKILDELEIDIDSIEEEISESEESEKKKNN